MNLYQHYQQLLYECGNPVKYWPQWCAKNKLTKDREKIIIGMILVQRTNWHNADVALKNLKEEGLLSIKKITELNSLEKLTQLIRPAGFYQSKPRRLVDICSFVVNQGGIGGLMKNETTTVRQRLLDIKGVGQETADTILLYALDKPVFIIDEYTRRWVKKNKLISEKSYFLLQRYFESNLPKNVHLYQSFHCLIIVSQKGQEKSVMEMV